MHPKIQHYLEQIKPHYHSPEDLTQLVEMLAGMGASAMQAFITLHEGLGLEEDLVDKYVESYQGWVKKSDMDSFIHAYIYSSSRYQRNRKKN